MTLAKFKCKRFAVLELLDGVVPPPTQTEVRGKPVPKLLEGLTWLQSFIPKS